MRGEQYARLVWSDGFKLSDIERDCLADGADESELPHGLYSLDLAGAPYSLLDDPEVRDLLDDPRVRAILRPPITPDKN